jgi:hypothetical protein
LDNKPTGNLNTARNSLAGAGTQTAGLAFGGYMVQVITGATEEYDGSTWTTSLLLNTAREYLIAGAGTQTAALGFGGYTTAATGATEEYDGCYLGNKSWKFEYSKTMVSRLWNSNSSFSFWW